MTQIAEKVELVDDLKELSPEEQLEQENFEKELEIRKKLLNKYVFSENTLMILDVAYSMNKNVILYGPGGHGKSELTEDFFREKGIEPFVLTMGKGMTVDKLLGGVDIPKFMEEGKQEYLVENSFMAHEYVIFEELLDCPDYILEQLKDILSSGKFRNGSQVYEIKTKMIVGNTNRTRDEYAKNDTSIRALLERFPLSLEVKWANYTNETYNKLFECRYGRTNYLLVEIIKDFNADKNSKAPISPRIALTAFDMIETCGEDCLKFIAEFSNNPALLQSSISNAKAAVEFHKYVHDLEEILTHTENNFKRLSSSSTLEELTKVTKDLTECTNLLKKFNSYKVPDSYTNEKAKVTDYANKKLLELKKLIESFTC